MSEMSPLAKAMSSECTLYLWKRSYATGELDTKCKECCVSHCPFQIRERYCPFILEQLENEFIDINERVDDE